MRKRMIPVPTVLSSTFVPYCSTKKTTQKQRTIQHPPVQCRIKAIDVVKFSAVILISGIGENNIIVLRTVPWYVPVPVPVVWCLLEHSFSHTVRTHVASTRAFHTFRNLSLSLVTGRKLPYFTVSCVPPGVLYPAPCGT